jgi:hypothetical protein
MALTNHEIYIRNWTEFGVAWCSLIASLLTIFVIIYMRQWNGYLLLIVSMVFFQIVYDVNFLLGVYPGFTACLAWNFLDVLGGLSLSFWTNILSYVVMYIVINIESFDIFGNYHYFCILTVVIPFILAVLAMTTIIPATEDDEKPFSFCVYDGSPFSLVLANIYYWSRIGSILFNIFAFFYITWRVKSLHIISDDSSVSHLAKTTSIETRGHTSTLSLSQRHGTIGYRTHSMEEQRIAIATLAARIKYYPIAQVISRSGAIWSEFRNYRYSSFTSEIMNAITGPTLGIFCFLIFLVSELIIIIIFLSY